MRASNPVLAVFLTLLCGVANAENTAQQAFAKLSTLVGNWEGRAASGRVTRVNFRLSANDSVLVETSTMSPTRESMTLYALDGARLLATHYCPQGNQPRLVFSGESADGSYRFGFLDGTNLQVPDGSHQYAFWTRIESADVFWRSETYVENTKKDFSDIEPGPPVAFHRITGAK